jgi:hypothetical protein
MASFGLIDSKTIDMKRRIKMSSRAIENFIEIMKDKYYMEFEILTLGDDKNLMKIANEVIRRSNIPINARTDLTVNKTTKFYDLWMNKSSIVLSSHEELKIGLRADFSQVEYRSVYFLIHCPYATEDDNAFYSSKTVFIPERLFNLAHTFSGNMTLIGTEIVSKNSCEPVARSMNTFLASTMRWNTTNFIPQYKNFYGCELEVCYIAAWRGYWYIFGYEEKNGTHTVNGLSTNLLPFLKQHLRLGNFKYVNMDKEDYHCDLLLYYHRYKYLHEGSENSQNYTFFTNHAETYPIMYQEFETVVTKGLAYTPIEKLFLPFDLETWIMIMITFAIGFLTIFIIYRCNRFVQRFVFGTFVRDPSLYLTSIFFGIGVTRLPTRNFARYLFMVFTLYCLIIRTAYQGKMYEFLNKDMRKPTAKTMDDIADMKIPMLYEVNELNITIMNLSPHLNR